MKGRCGKLGHVIAERKTFLKSAFRINQVRFCQVVIEFGLECLAIRTERFCGARHIADFC